MTVNYRPYVGLRSTPLKAITQDALDAYLPYSGGIVTNPEVCYLMEVLPLEALII